MDRLMFDGNFCDIAQCIEERWRLLKNLTILI